MKYTIIKNGVVDNVIVADEAYVLANHAQDIAILGEYPMGWTYENGSLRSSDTLAVNQADVVGMPPNKPILPLTSISIASPANLVGAIYWLQKDTLATISGDVALPDGFYMIMAERVINGSTVVDDVRFKATVTAGVISMPVSFPVAGNYIISAKRLNEGLNRIGAAVNLSFGSVEFDIYV